jgi:hypothetical protein
MIVCKQKFQGYIMAYERWSNRKWHDQQFHNAVEPLIMDTLINEHLQ